MKPFLPTLALGALLTTLAGPSLAQKQTPLERGKYLSLIHISEPTRPY